MVVSMVAATTTGGHETCCADHSDPSLACTLSCLHYTEVSAASCARGSAAGLPGIECLKVQSLC